jgi:hypothetical protein
MDGYLPRRNHASNYTNDCLNERRREVNVILDALISVGYTISASMSSAPKLQALARTPARNDFTELMRVSFSSLNDPALYLL